MDDSLKTELAAFACGFFLALTIWSATRLIFGGSCIEPAKTGFYRVYDSPSIPGRQESENLLDKRTSLRSSFPA